MESISNPNTRIHFFYEDVDGLLDIERIYEENGKQPCYFISGPPAMISNFKQSLLDKGLPDDRVITDDWS